MTKKQKINTKAELADVNYLMPKMIWRIFLTAEGYIPCSTIPNQDNRSVIQLEMNGYQSSGQCMHHLNIHNFFIKDQNEQDG